MKENFAIKNLILFLLSTAVVQSLDAQRQKKGPLKPQPTVVAPAALAEPAAQARAETPTSTNTATQPAAPKWYESVKITGMVRVRPEVKENYAFDAGQRYNFVGQKVWLSAEKVFDDKTKMVITLQDARIWGGQNPTITDTSTEQQATDIREAYVQMKDFFFTPFELKLGRQKLEYGEQMLVGALDW
jgi:hypothetical protein